MATVYSLICWGGRTGKTVSISASTDVVTLTNHGLRDGTKLWPSGTLPGELNTSTPVYARSTASNTFTLHTSSADAIANTGQILFSGSSTYGAVNLKSDAMLEHMSAHPTRWGGVGSERIYDGLMSWKNARNASGIGAYDNEVCEIGMGFVETNTSTILIDFTCASTLITASVNGNRTSGFHFGSIGTGFALTVSTYWFYSVIIKLSGFRGTLDGISIYSTGAETNCVDISGVANTLQNSIVHSYSSGSNNSGVFFSGQASGCFNNIAYKQRAFGFRFREYANQATIATNNLAVGNGQGFICGAAQNSVGGWYYNNAAVGNTSSNWDAGPSACHGAGFNGGASGDTPWFMGTDTGVKTLTPDNVTFVYYANADFRPAGNQVTHTTSSPLVDGGIVPVGVAPVDMLGNIRPGYKNGSPEIWDLGPFEYDHGYGPHPASHELTLTNVVVGSRVFIRDQADTVTHYDDVAASSTVVVAVTVYGDSRDNWRIKVRKASSGTTYIPYETLMTATAGSSSIYVSQIPDE